MLRPIAVALGAIAGSIALGAVLFSGTAHGAVTMATPAAGPLPRTFEFVADGPGGVATCVAEPEGCLATDLRTTVDSAGKHHYFATVWVAPLRPITLRVAESGGAPVDFAYQVTENRANPFALSMMDLTLERASPGIGQIELRSYYFLLADHNYLTKIVVRRKVGRRWIVLEPDPGSRETSPTAASFLGNAVWVDQQLSLRALKRRPHQLVVSYRIPLASFDFTRKIKLTSRQFARGKTLEVRPPTPTPIYP